MTVKERVSSNEDDSSTKEGVIRFNGRRLSSRRHARELGTTGVSGLKNKKKEWKKNEAISDKILIFKSNRDYLTLSKYASHEHLPSN